MKYQTLKVSFCVGRQRAAGARIIPTDEHVALEIDRPNDYQTCLSASLCCLMTAHGMWSPTHPFAELIALLIQAHPDEEDDAGPTVSGMKALTEALSGHKPGGNGIPPEQTSFLDDDIPF